jgi:hypothetical protein
MKELDIIKQLLENDVKMEPSPKTFEDDPMNFILKKYDNLKQVLINLMSENFKELLTGIYIIAYKPSTFKIVLHNGQYFFLTFMGKAYQATIAGKNYFLMTLDQQQASMMAITRLLRFGSPLKVKGPEGAEQSTEDAATEETPPAEGETPPAEGGEESESLEESKNILSILINENKLVELARNKFDILSDKAKTIANAILDKFKTIEKSQIQPANKNRIVIYSDDRKNLVNDIEEWGIYGTRNEPNSGDFKTEDGVVITIKPDKTSGEYYQLKPQFLGVDVDVFIPVETLRSQLKEGIKKAQRLSKDQKKFILAIMGEKKPSQEIIDSCLQDTKFINEINKNLGEPIGAILYAEQINGKQIFFPGKGNYPLIDYRVKKARGPIVDVSAKIEGKKGNIVKFSDVYTKIKEKGLDAEMTKKQKLIFDTVVSARDGENVAIKILKLANLVGTDKTKKMYADFIKANPGFLDKSKRDFKKYPGHGYNSFEMARIQKFICKDINDDSKTNFSDLFQKAIGTIYVKFYFDKSTLEPHINVYSPDKITVYVESKASTNHTGENIGFQIKTE